jgi:hypothetical protein
MEAASIFLARLVSNEVCDQREPIVNKLGLSDFVWQWGQFLDHDIDETPIASPAEPFDIEVPTGDPWFDPDGLGGETIPLDRSAYEIVGGVRQQLNNITSFIDASNVYGSEEDRAHELRTNDGTGRLKVSAGDLLPYNTAGLDNAPSANIPTFFLAGDVRANEQVGLIAMHTLFVREHNRLADLIAQRRPGLSGDEIYEWARAMVAAEMQAITYREFLPKLLGEGAIPPYRGYRPSVDPGIANEFATAAYRVGHTMLSPVLRRVEASGFEAAEGHIDLADAFFNPSEIEANGIDTVLRGLASQHAQDVDVFVIDDVRNFLFGQPGMGGFDLPSLNIQRGRDHGLPSYNDLRAAMGRMPASSFAEITEDVEVRDRLASVYTSVNDVDAWVGMLAEPHREGAFVGETLYRVIREQFVRLRDGDRFWYEVYLPRPMIQEVEELTLSRIIQLNTGIGDELQEDVFAFDGACHVDVAEPIGVLDERDLIAFLRALFQGEPWTDLDGDGQYGFVDFLLFLEAFLQGCDG